MVRRKRTTAVFAAVLIVCILLLRFLWSRGVYGNLTQGICETEQFRQMNITPQLYRETQTFAENHSCDPMKVLAAVMILERMEPADGYRLKEEIWERADQVLNRKRKEAYEALSRAYRTVFGELECFPVTEAGAENTGFSYENTFGAVRNYGGERRHEGCDVFGDPPIAGRYPVLSVCDGVVEKIGWLPLGGYRIGIRSSGGGYFYYAHLDSYEKEFQEGDKVRAGEVLGLMGDTGYGEEGSRGKFPAHLHFGCYIRTEHSEEVSVNSYPILQILEDRKYQQRKRDTGNGRKVSVR